MDVCWVGGKGHTGKYMTFVFSDDSRSINPVPSQTQPMESTATVLASSLVLSPGLGRGRTHGLRGSDWVSQPQSIRRALLMGAGSPRPSVTRPHPHHDPDYDQV